MKRKSFFQLFLALVLALGWLGFQTWQSIHRFEDHDQTHAEGEGEHHDCEMCDWEAPIMEMADPVFLKFVCIQPASEKPIALIMVYAQCAVSHCSGRGPPAMK